MGCWVPAAPRSRAQHGSYGSANDLIVSFWDIPGSTMLSYSSVPAFALIWRNPRETTMAGLLLIVSRTKPGTFAYLKLVSESGDVVILDRRESDRRRIHQQVTPERRNGERRRRDVMSDLHKAGWALVRGRHVLVQR